MTNSKKKVIAGVFSLLVCGLSFFPAYAETFDTGLVPDGYLINDSSDEIVSASSNSTTTLAISGFDGTRSDITTDSYEPLTDGSSVTENGKIYIFVDISDYINHELYINNEKMSLEGFLSGDGYYYFNIIQATGTSMSIELREEPWTSERLSGYVTADVGENVLLYYYNPYSFCISKQMSTGDYIEKGTPICVRVKKTDMPTNGNITINGEKVDFELNEDGLYQIWNYTVPDDADVLEVKIVDDAVKKSVMINSENFPDESFRNYVSSNFDTDGNGELSPSELAAVTTINVSSCGITDLKGIEYFTDLTELYADVNSLTSIDVSQNTALEYLGLEHNPSLGSIDVSKNKALINLDVLNCGLTSLDITSNTALKYLFCHCNSIESLHTSNNTELEVLCCWGNSLTSLDLKNNTKLQKLYCYNNSISSLDLTNNTALTYVKADESTVITGFTQKYTTLSISGFETIGMYDLDKSCILGDFVISEDGSSVSAIESGDIYIYVNINEYINHELYVNDEKVSLELSGDGYYYGVSINAAGTSMSIELREESWTADRLSGYAAADVGKNVQLYYYNPYIYTITQQISTGDYIKKGTPVCVRVEKDDMPENGYITINGEKVEFELNEDGQYQIWNYTVPDDADSLKVRIVDPSASEVITGVTVTNDKVIVAYGYDSNTPTRTEELDFDKVTTDIVNYMAHTDIQLCIDFVNKFNEAANDDSDFIILTEAQMYAIEKVLEYDNRDAE